MLSTMLLVGALSSAEPDPLARAIERNQRVKSYRATIHSVHADAQEHLRYFHQKPGFVRMEFIHPHAGALLVYSPTTQRVRLWPLGEGHFPELNLSPANPLIRSSRNQRVDQSDTGALFDNVQQVRSRGRLEQLEEQELAGHRVLHLRVVGTGQWTVAGIHSYELWLDAATLFPVKVLSRDLQEDMIESVLMDDVEIDIPLPTGLFNP